MSAPAKRKRRGGVSTQQSARRRAVSTHRSASPSTESLMRPAVSRNRTATKMTGAQRNSEGRRSEWSMSIYSRGAR